MQLLLRPVAALLMLGTLSGCASVPASPWDRKPKEELVLEQSIQLMGGAFKVRLWFAENQVKNAKKFFDTTFHELKRVSAIADNEDPKSEISRLNTLAFNRDMKVSPELFRLILMGQSLFNISEGVFDVTFVPIQDEVEKYGADAGLDGGVQEFTPQVDPELRKKIGQKNLFLDQQASTVKFTRRGMKIGVKGLAKGYAMQKAAEKLQMLKMRGFAIVGGGVFVAGGEALKDPDLMCIENPSKLGTCLYKVLPADPRKLFSMGMAATLDWPGRIFNPKTGKRAITKGAITLAGPDAAWVQAAAVTLSALDESKSEAFLQRAGKSIVTAVLFESPDKPELEGTFAPHAKIKKIE